MWVWRGRVLISWRASDLHRHCYYGPGAERVLFDNREKVVQAVSLEVGNTVRVLYSGKIGTIDGLETINGAKWFAVRFGESGTKAHYQEASLSLFSPVQSPAHYDLPGGIQVIDLIRNESFLRGNLLKYVFRAPHKGNELEDLKKAAEYLKWEIERVEAK